MVIFSIIVPIYNVEPYIERALQSLCDQELPQEEYEIILIDDGSTDKSIHLAQAYADQHPNIRIYSYPNQGLSVARNRGIEIAQGSYIMFVDSDDWISSNILSALSQTIRESHQPDILGFEAVKEWDSTNSKKHFTLRAPYHQPITGCDYLLKYTVYSGVWLYAYSRSFIEQNHLSMVAGIFHEDEEFLTRAFLYAQQIVFTDLLVYHYYQREGSIVNDQSKYEKRISDTLYIAATIDKLRKEHGANTTAYKALSFRLYTLTRDFMLWSATGQRFNDVIEQLKELKLYPIDHSSTSIKHQLVTFMLNHHRQFLWILKYLRAIKG